MTDYARKIIELRAAGMSSYDIARWAQRRNVHFSPESLKAIVTRNSTKIRKDIASIIEDLHARLCA